ncbi:hypothetical protein IBX73_00520 [candidate division WOR-3 bacterium]|nr:hypothetical protein [candidate division WOR-3 bacterium]
MKARSRILVRGMTFYAHVCCLLVLFSIVPGALDSATYVVNRTVPDDNNPGSLRWCMNGANANPGPDTILFNIAGAGPFVIPVVAQLPVLTDQAGVLIDGFSQPGTWAGANPPSTANLLIVIDGTNAGASHGIHVFSSNNTVQGLVVQNFQQDGIRVQARPDVSQNNMIYSNFVGTDQTGTLDLGNGTNMQGLWAGIYVICTPGTLGVAINNVVHGNLSSGNYAEGIGVASCPPGDVAFNSVLNNYVGTDVAGAIDLGNDHDGVYIGEGAHDNVVDGNLISGNDYEGVCIVGYAEAMPPVVTYANAVTNNIIGLDVALAPLPNTRDGVSIGIYGTYLGGYATDNIIATNTIAHNGRNGVLVWEHWSSNINADQNRITQNSIYNNSLLGIDLGDNGITYNDAGDFDTGANEEVNYPVITSAVHSAGQATISGSLDIDTDPTQANVEVFRASPDPSGYGEGRFYLGLATPNAAGNWSVVVPGVVAGDTITATTTDMNSNTSEFSQNFVVVTGIEEHSVGQSPQRYELAQNRPNPFTGGTLISYTLVEFARLDLGIYDVSGRLVRTLFSGHRAPGTHTAHWDGIDNEGRLASPGVYMCVLDAGGFMAMRKMVFAQ